MADSKVAWKTALTPQKAPTYGNQAMIITCPNELQMLGANYIIVFEGTKKYHVTTAKIINPYTLHVLIPEHDTAEEVTVEVYLCRDNSSSELTSLKFTYVSQMEHAIAKFLAQSASDPEVAEKLDAVWAVCLGKDHVDLWDKRLAQAFSQLELPLDWTLVGNVLESDAEFRETLLHFAANHGLKELIKVFLERPGAKLALSKCDKSGLLPRDVARENGRLDLVELLDSERFDERSKTAKDSNWCKVRQNKEYGIATITNVRGNNKQEDVLLLHDLNKLAQPKNGSPTCRHSWPGKAESFHADIYLDDLEYKLGKTSFGEEQNNDGKRQFLDGNLICLRDVTEELSQLRALNSQMTSSEISVIAERNRTPMHSRRLSCPASVSRKRKVPSQDFSRNAGPTLKQSPTLQTGEQNKKKESNELLSSPPHSPLVGQLIDIGSTVTITPPQDEPPPVQPPSKEETTMQAESQLTTAALTVEQPSTEPTSPMPISYRFENNENRPLRRKGRPNTWYGGPAASRNEEEMLRRSNSLEDFAKMLALNEDSDNDSIETHSKDDALGTISSITDRVDRKESFLSSLSDLSTGKDSIESDGEMGQDDDSDEEKIRDGGTLDANVDDKGDEGIVEHEEENEQDVEEHREEKQQHKTSEIVQQHIVDEQVEDKEEYVEHEGGSKEHEKEPEELHEDNVEDEVVEENERKFEDHQVDDQEHEEKEEGEDEHEHEENKVDYEEHEEVLEDKREDEEHKVELEEHQEKDDGEKEHEKHVEDHEKHAEDREGSEEDHEEHFPGVDHEGHGEAEEDKRDEKHDDNEDMREHKEDKVEQDLYKQGKYWDTEEREELEEILEHKKIPDQSGSLIQDATEQHDDNDEELKVNEEQYREAARLHEPHVQDTKEHERYDRREGTDEYSEIRKAPLHEIEENGDEIQKERLEMPNDQVLDQEGLHHSEEPFAHENYVHSQGSIEEEPEHIMQDEISAIRPERKVVASDDTVKRRDSDDKHENKSSQKHIRFNETTKRSQSPIPSTEENSTDETQRNSFRQRSGAVQSSAILLTLTKAPVKRTGSDISVTSLQDVQLDVHSTATRNDDLGAQSNLARKAKSFGDLSSFRDASVHMKDDDSDEDILEEERRRFREDQKQLSVQKRIKKFEDCSKYGGSTEKINQITGSRAFDREDEEQGKRRWSNFFNAKNPKPSKKPGRTPTFRRDNLRSSMSSIVGKGSGKKTIESLVQNQNAAFTKHSSTAPNANNGPMSRPRSWTKESPGSVRKFQPTAVNEAADETKPHTESPDDAPTEEPVNDSLDLEVDSDLENFEREPETWCETMEKKTVSKMSKKEIKRQDIILELIKTEYHHLRTLKIMQQVFYRGLNKWANYSWEKLDQLFPRINELVDLSVRFHRNLRCRQDEQAVVGMIGDIIVKHFSDENGRAIVQAYGEFVSKHQEGVAQYKHYFKTDKKFSNFIKKCHGNKIVRRLSIPECFTLVTQRLTKYPPLIEAMMKVTKKDSSEHKLLVKSLGLVKEALKAVDNAIKDYEKQTKLKEIKSRMEKGSVVLKSGVKIKNSRFSDDTSKMIADGILNWRSARGKLAETHVVLLDSMVVFLQENDKKFSLLSVDGKAPCIALKTLMVREVATDKNAIYFVSTSANERREPEMYEFVCGNNKEKKQWLFSISEAIKTAPEDIGDLFQSPEEERRLAEERLNRRNEILEIMKTKDKELSRWVEEKNSLCSEMKELLNALSGNEKAKEEEKILTSSKVREILLVAIRRTTQLTADTVQRLHESHSDSELVAAAQDEKASAPKRAETFGGFDRRPSAKLSRRQESTVSEGGADVNHVSHRRDSGFSTESFSSALNILNQGQDAWGPGSFLQILEALQWVLNQFNLKETALENLRAQLQAAVDDVAQLQQMKQNEDKKRVLMEEEHQAELARQKKAQVEQEKAFRLKIEHLEGNMKAQQDNQRELMQEFMSLQKRVMRS